jgi:tight adherence protein C
VLALVEKRLIMAGKIDECTAPQFMAVCVLGALSMWLLMFYLVSDSHYLLIQKAVFILLGGILGGLMPVVCLNTMAQKRQEQIVCQLPEVLDLLCVSVQAGLSFDAALSKITARMKGELIRECKHMQEDIRMGMVRRTAMKNMADRCDVQDVSLFMTSVIQAERLGTSMGKTLKNQADNIRERRRQYIKAEAMRAPVKIVFPLVIFIFPALFVVTLVPTLLFLIKNML